MLVGVIHRVIHRPDLRFEARTRCLFRVEAHAAEGGLAIDARRARLDSAAAVRQKHSINDRRKALRHAPIRNSSQAASVAFAISSCAERNASHARGMRAALCITVKSDRSCPLWVKSGHGRMSDQCPLCPRKRTWFSTIVMSALCHKRTLPMR